MGKDKFVTASEAGINGDEQVKIALETMAANNGIAQTRQIYMAVEAVLKEKGFGLSSQGKASLRFFVNKVAVNEGYVYPSDRRISGWRITPQGRAHIEAISSGHEKSTKMITKAGDNFQFSLSDVYALLKADQDTEVFKRAGIILTVTAWETFIEDTLTLHFEKRMKEAQTPGDIESTFNELARVWIDNQKSIHPPDIVKWTGEGWKNILLGRFNNEIARFNTPNSENIKKFFKRYLDLDVENSWQWRGMTPQTACQKLDKLIELRGELVHRGRNPSVDETKVDRDQLLEMIALVEQLAWSIEATWGMTLKENE